MGALTNVYVAATSGNDGTGDGSSGAPYKTLQYLLNNHTKDTTNGNFINLSGTDVLSASLSLATWGAGSATARQVFRTWVGGPDGDGVIDGNAGNFVIFAGGVNYITFYDLELTNTGTASILTNLQFGEVINCIVHKSGTTGIHCGGGTNFISNNYIYDCAVVGVQGATSGVQIISNYFANGPTNDFSSSFGAILTQANQCSIYRNILSIDSASLGIVIADGVLGTLVKNNSILSASGTGKGIVCGNASLSYILNNLVEGFSGVGGVGISATGDLLMSSNNALYNNTTQYSITDQTVLGDDNETLGATPFAKSGSDTFANRAVYFAPVDTGNVQGGAYPTELRLDKGAVQHADPAAGGLIRHPGMTGGLNG